MKLKLSSLRFRMLLPVIAMTLFVVALLTVLFSRAYTSMILQQEQAENAVGFDLVSRSVTPLIESSIAEVQSVLTDSRVASYARRQYATDAQLVHARISCRDYLRGELSRQEGIFGLLFMRQDGSLFGVLPEFNFFLDDPQQNPLSEDMISQILNVPLGRTIWVGPTSGASLYGFENEKTPQSIMIAAWKSVDVRYGELYALMLMDDSIFARLFSTLHPWIAFRLGNGWSRHSRLARNEEYVFKGPEEPLYKWALDFSERTHVDCFIFGHLHAQVDLTLPTGARLIVMKDWMDLSQYWYFDGILVGVGHSMNTE